MNEKGISFSPNFLCSLHGIRAMVDPPKEGEKLSNHYSLNSNDNSGNIITQVQLRGENYDEWARAMWTALRAKKKYGFFDGMIKQPVENAQEIENWWTINSMLISCVKDL